MSWVAQSWGLRLNCTGPGTIPAVTTMNCSSSHAKHRVLVVVGSGSGELVLKGLGVSDKDIFLRRNPTRRDCIVQFNPRIGKLNFFLPPNTKSEIFASLIFFGSALVVLLFENKKPKTPYVNRHLHPPRRSASMVVVCFCVDSYCRSCMNSN
jgi:hypothetical protein